MAGDWRNLGYMGICKQKGSIIWLTGLSGAGKSTIAAILQTMITESGKMAYVLDGDKLRNGLNSDLGFSREDRRENIRRVAHVAALLYEAGFVTIVSVISPQEDMRKYARSLVPNGEFTEVYIKADVEECIKRDPKGLYKKALENLIPEFTGVTSPYEEPSNPEIIIDTQKISAQEAAGNILKYIL